MSFVCPIDRLSLTEMNGGLACPRGHAFPIVDGIPVLLREDVAQTMPLIGASIASGRHPDLHRPLFLDSVGVSEDQKRLAEKLHQNGAAAVDPVVAVLVAATSGYAYAHLVGNLSGYPIPVLPLPPGENRQLLDIGCNWGRWSIAAVRAGYSVTGVDPSLGALLAAQRVSRQLGLDIRFVCADARFLPFEDASFDVVFSYSVIQHFSKPNARAAFAEMSRVLSDHGKCLVQMAHAFGVRSLYHQARRGFREPKGFEVRYWTIRELAAAFSERFKTRETLVHCYFGLGLESSDSHLMPTKIRLAISASDLLRRISRRVPLLRHLADSLYVQADSPRRPEETTQDRRPNEGKS